jgi:4-amino-4-deoxy-L-arabinose transferase-like glycosyltransferase
MGMHDRLGRVAIAVLAVAAAILFFTAPRQGDFWWADASRHAMDGLFYHDFFRDLPLSNPFQWAMDYYLRNPCLSILFYPPLFPLVEALFFAIFGVSHSTAVLTVIVFYFAASLGAYFLSRRWFDWLPSLGIAILFSGLPEVALWGRQAMLEIPCAAFQFWFAWFLLRYQDQNRPKDLYLAILMFWCALYTKQTIAFMGVVAALTLLASRGLPLLRDRTLWKGLAGLGIASAPLLFVTLKFDRVNVNSVVGGDWTKQQRGSLDAWSFYLRALPDQVTWPVVALAALGVAMIAVRRHGSMEWVRFLAVWFGAGYLMFSGFALREPRHTIVILYPVAVLAVYGLTQLLPGPPGQAAGAVAALACFAYTVLVLDVPRVGGYGDAAQKVAALMPQNGVVLFNGYRDGNFIFNMREYPKRQDVYVLRADKLLLRVVQRRELGVQEKPYSEAEIAELIRSYGVTHVVNQANFWNDLQVLQRLQRVLASPQFRKIAVVPLHPNRAELDRELEIYETLGPVAKGGKRIEVELPIVGITVTGMVGGKSR